MPGFDKRTTVRTPRRSRRTILALAAAATWFAFARPEPAPAQTAPAVRSGPSGPVLAWVSAVEAGDVAAIARLNGPDTIAYVPDTMVLRGGAEIGAAYAAMFARYTAAVRISDAYYVDANGLVHSWGLYTLVLKPRAGGADVTLNGRFSDLAMAVDGGWRYVMDHASLPAGK